MLTAQEKLELYEAANVDNLVRMRLVHFKIPGYSREDLYQEGRLAAWVALDKFNPDIGRVEAFLSTAIKIAMILILRKSLAKKRIQQGDNYFQGRFGYETADCESPEVQLLEFERKLAISRTVANIRSRLTGNERKVIDCHLSPPQELVGIISGMGRKKISKSVLSRYLKISAYSLKKIIRELRKEISSELE